ncbi:MAG TPA: hypothetical protein VEG60_24915, partial [Candidatus Binatia bacterium]|nr:hypothetical protein [Candidatus Binatia bacterium]
GKRWSEAGLLTWLKVAFYKTFKPEFWTKPWNTEGYSRDQITLASDFLEMVHHVTFEQGHLISSNFDRFMSSALGKVQSYLTPIGRKTLICTVVCSE